MSACDPTFVCTASADDVSLSLVGDWQQQRDLPSPTTLYREVAASNGSQSKRLHIDGSQLASWDSGAVNRVYHLTRLAEAEQWTVTSELPEGAQRLLELALALPAAGQGASNRQVANIGSRLVSALSAIGASVSGFVIFLGAITRALGKSLLGQTRIRLKDIAKLCFQTGPDALPIITVSSLLIGVILAYLGAVQLQQFGAAVYVADLVTIGVLREMGPLMTAVILAGRTGAAYAAQLGTMRVNEEIDAIAILGISIIEFLVLPRVIAITVILPLLTLYANLLGIAGGGLVAMGLDVSPMQYWQQLQGALLPVHALIGLIKALIFGLLISIAACRAGLSAGKDSAGVGQATTQAVVVALIYLVIADAAINIICQQMGI